VWVALGYAAVIGLFLAVSRYAHGQHVAVFEKASKRNSVTDSCSPCEGLIDSKQCESEEVAVSTVQKSLRSYVDQDQEKDVKYQGKPVADLFTECTVIIADITGFTAWSSMRSPSQVFVLLETLHQALYV